MTRIRRTKIVCTLGPAVDSLEAVCELLRAGMNVARLNFSHGTQEEHGERIARLREACRQTGESCAVLLDTKGPEIRTGRLRDDQSFEVRPGDRLTITTEDVAGTPERIGISYGRLTKEISVGAHIYIADGLIDLEVLGVEGSEVRCVVRSGGTLGSRKNVNIPGIRVQLPAMTDQDLRDIRYGIDKQVDFVAASFIRTPSDVEEIQAVIRDHHSPIKVIAKIEDEEGLSNIQEIARTSDGIMVARGDLGVQLSIEQIPLAQKRIIAVGNAGNKPVITATQMLDSMIRNPRPTRAEVTDVANAIFDGTDAVMLSGETASGRYPVEACRTLDRIARVVESSPEYRARVAKNAGPESGDGDIGEAVACAACLVAHESGASAIIAPSLRGNTPRLLSRYRPAQPIIAVTTSEVVQRQLLLVWGIVPFVTTEIADSQRLVPNAIQTALQRGYADRGDRVVTVAGEPLRSALPMNTIRVHILGTIINRGHDGFGATVTGRAIKAADADEARDRLKLDATEILVTPLLSEQHVELLPGLLGVIVEHRSQLPHDTVRNVNAGLVLVAEVPDAMADIEDGITLTLDGTEKIVYEGVL